MSTRRSGRATKEVKYTSASEGSDFEDKKKRTKKTSTTKKAAPKKSTKKRAAESENDDNSDNASANANAAAATTTTAPKPKRQKKDPATLAAEAQEKQAKADKAAHKKAWQDWLASHDDEGEMLEEEPSKDESITQTDALKKYGLKKEELTSLLRFEKKNPLYPGMMKLFLEEDVRALAFRKIGTLEGVEGDEEEIVKKGEELWTEEHKDDIDESEEKDTKTEIETETKDKTKDKTATKDGNADKPAKAAKPKKENKAVKAEKPNKEKTQKQQWAAYISENALDSGDDKLAEEPSDVINQTECKNKYSLTPKDLACLPHLLKKNPPYGNNTKLFRESEVKSLVYRKTAVLAGEEDNGKDDDKLLKKGRAFFMAQNGLAEDE
ncbi:hypothetical protein G6011_06472 [Alternaria panax]|uniref:XPA C-terminal domain-containing protein n=1 Tax=Alternaria panax TaxID=48097 RepID=A0AAD4FLE8_9PLEO|nr:hypothetical protein G6011_06472 [Alternaria panax]